MKVTYKFPYLPTLTKSMKSLVAPLLMNLKSDFGIRVQTARPGMDQSPLTLLQI